MSNKAYWHILAYMNIRNDVCLLACLKKEQKIGLSVAYTNLQCDDTMQSFRENARTNKIEVFKILVNYPSL